MARKWSDKQIKQSEKAIKKALEEIENASTQVVVNTDDELTAKTEQAEELLRDCLIKLGKLS